MLLCCGGVLLSHTLPGAVPSALWGLASGFGMGAGRFPHALTAASWSTVFMFSTFPRVLGGCGLVVIRTVVDELCLFCVSPVIGVLLFSVGQLVPVGSRAPRGASTSGLSTR